MIKQLINYSEGIKSGFTSLKDAFDFVEKRVVEEEYSTTYLSILNLTNSQLKDKLISQTTYSTNNHKAFRTTSSLTDVVYNQAKYIM